jgi:lipooligosaccharide transport system permease protein
MAWIALRLSMMSTAFLLVMTAFGVPRSPLAVLAVPAAVLTGLAFSAPMAAFAATIRNDNSFNIIFRWVTTPLFLFSGIFFPVSQLPEALRLLAPATPLYHGVALARGAVLGGMEWSDAAGHAAYLVVMFTIGLWLAFRQFTRKLYV